MSIRSHGAITTIAKGADSEPRTEQQPYIAGVPTDRSGTIAAPAAAQQLAPANLTRRWLFVQNNSLNDMWLNFGVDAVASQPSILIAAGGSWESSPAFCPSTSVSIYGTLLGDAFTAKEG